jgi:hypothetical protein
MQKSKTSLGIGSILGILFFFSLLGSIMFQQYIFDFIVGLSGSEQIAESQKALQDTTDLLISVDKITFDTTVLANPYLQTLVNLPNFPIDAQTISNFGKVNPFIGNFIVVPTKVTASTTVGAVVYSNQRSVNNGNSLRPVNSNTRR